VPESTAAVNPHCYRARMDLDREQYVSITTRRRDGRTVSSPVWIAPLGDGRYGFTTGSGSGKVKRIAHTPGVTLRPCDRRGTVAADAPTVAGTARVVSGAEAAPVRSAIAAKYGWQFRLIELMGAVQRVVKRSTAADCAVIVELTV